MVDFMVVVVGMMVIIEVKVMFGVGMPVSDEIMRNSIGMGTRQELGVDVMRPLWEKRSRTPFCTLVTGKNILE